MSKSTRLIVTLLIIPQTLLVNVLTHYPQFIETYYSNGLYIFISRGLRFVFGWLPFSFGDVLYVLITVLILKWITTNWKTFFKKFKSNLLHIAACISIIYASFHVFWGFNYYRLPLHTSLNIETEYTTELLIETTKKLIVKSNAIHYSINKNDSVAINLPYTQKEVFDKAVLGYKEVSKIYSFLQYQTESIKPALLSLPLSYMGFSGYLNPLTNEAHINYKIPNLKKPITTAHEIAHQIGYAAENEANFIAFLVTVNTSDNYMQYAGYTFALRHCLNEIYRRDPNAFNTLVKTVNPGILKNFEQYRTFWDSYQNPLEPLFKKTYSSYLKANKQQGGLKSYSYVVALVVNYSIKNNIFD